MSYSIRHDKVREKRGMPSYGVFYDDGNINRGMSVHRTREEAEAAKADYEKSGKKPSAVKFT